MDLKIFDVEHGACALLTCDDNTRLMLDCGHNATTNWRPGTYLKGKGINVLDMLAVTNYDEDHVSGIDDLLDNMQVSWLSRNPTVSSNVLRNLKSEDGMGRGIDTLCGMIDRYTSSGSPEPKFAGLKRSIFYNSYPTFDDENNLSQVNFLECHGVGVLFTGDLEKPGWLKLMERQEFRAALAKTHVLIASHHGRQGGCCEEAMKLMEKSLYFVVISDKGYMHDTQETVSFYRAHARGGTYRGETRAVLTTRKDGMIGFRFASDSWGSD